MLKYTGGGFGGFLNGIPARDLAAEEVARLGGEAVLVATGLYVSPGSSPSKEAIPVPEPGSINLSDGVSDTEASLASRTLNERKKGK